MRKLAGLALVMLILLAAVSPLAAQQNDITGVWVYKDGGATAQMTLAPDGNYQFNMISQDGAQTATGSYTATGEMIIVIFEDTGNVQEMRYRLTGPNSMELNVDGTILSMTRKDEGQQRQGAFSRMLGGNQAQEQRRQAEPREQPRPEPQQNQGGEMGNRHGSLYGGGEAQYTDHQHPAGFTFSAPADWSKHQDQMVLIMMPPDAYQTNQGPAEAAMVYAEQAQGITSALDPQVEQYFNTQIKQIFPYLNPLGGNQTKSGAVYAYSGRSPLEIDMTGHLYVKLENDVALVSFGICPTERMQQRDHIFYSINATSSFGGAGQGTPGGQIQQMPGNQGGPGQARGQNTQPRGANAPDFSGNYAQPGANQQDPLVALWTYTTENRVNDQVTTYVHGLQLRPDGSYEMVTKQQGAGQWSVNGQGRWSSDGNNLTLVSNDGERLEFTYQITGDGAVFTHESGEEIRCQRGQR